MVEHDRDDDDRLTREERLKLRRLLSALDTNEKQRAFEDIINLDPQSLRRVLDLFSQEARQRAIADLIEAQPAIRAFLEAKRSTEQMTTFVGKMAKWISAVIAAGIAIKALFFGGFGSPK